MSDPLFRLGGQKGLFRLYLGFGAVDGHGQRSDAPWGDLLRFITLRIFMVSQRMPPLWVTICT